MAPSETNPALAGNAGRTAAAITPNGRRNTARRRFPAWIRPNTWTLWTRPPSVITYVLLGEIAVMAGCLFTTMTADSPGKSDWFRFGALAVCATVHMQLSRRH